MKTCTESELEREKMLSNTLISHSTLIFLQLSLQSPSQHISFDFEGNEVQHNRRFDVNRASQSVSKRKSQICFSALVVGRGSTWALTEALWKVRRRRSYTNTNKTQMMMIFFFHIFWSTQHIILDGRNWVTKKKKKIWVKNCLESWTQIIDMEIFGPKKTRFRLCSYPYSAERELLCRCQFDLLSLDFFSPLFHNCTNSTTARSSSFPRFNSLFPPFANKSCKMS